MSIRLSGWPLSKRRELLSRLAEQWVSLVNTVMEGELRQRSVLRANGECLLLAHRHP